MNPSSMQQRVREAQDSLQREGFAGMIVIKPENVRYLAGVWGYSTRPEYASPRRLVALVLPARGDCTLVVPKIERLYAQRQTWIADVRDHVEWEKAGEVFGGFALLARVLKERGLIGERIAIETGFVSAKFVGMLQDDFPGTQFAESPAIVETLRMLKSAEEIDVLRVSGRMSVQEYRAEAGAVRAGVREFELAEIGRQEGTRAYAEALASATHLHDHALIDPIVDGMQIITSGERLDMVHALASTRALGPSDMVLLDFCRYPQFLGYRIGFSRMVSLRRPTPAEQDITRTTMQAFDLALSVLRPGVRAEEPDLIAREFLDKEGLGDTFVHRTGRGVGLEGVERPEIGAGDKTILRPGMVVTVEPSVYFPNFAVHVEDTFLITKDGFEVLTECPRDVNIVS